MIYVFFISLAQFAYNGTAVKNIYFKKLNWTLNGWDFDAEIWQNIDIFLGLSRINDEKRAVNLIYCSYKN